MKKSILRTVVLTSTGKYCPFSQFLLGGPEIDQDMNYVVIMIGFVEIEGKLESGIL